MIAFLALIGFLGFAACFIAGVVVLPIPYDILFMVGMLLAVLLFNRFAILALDRQRAIESFNRYWNRPPPHPPTLSWRTRRPR